MAISDGSSRVSRRSFIAGAASAGAALVLPNIGKLAVAEAATALPTGFPSRTDLLLRLNRQVITGLRTTQFRNDQPGTLYCLDARACTLYYERGDGNHAEISIGKGSPPPGPGIMGGNVIGQIPQDASWQTVKSNWDSAGVRQWAHGAQACYDLRVSNMEDGFEPFPGSSASGNTTDTFLLDGAYMSWIRDDAVENDYVMNGVINDSLFDGVNRFLSEQADSAGVSNPSSVVTVSNCLVRMVAMPNGRASDGMGYGGVFKWRDGAGSVAVSNSIFLLDEPPISDKPWPKGTYTKVWVILGPNYPSGGRPGYLPTSVVLTRDTSIWNTARNNWLATHMTASAPTTASATTAPTSTGPSGPSGTTSGPTGATGSTTPAPTTGPTASPATSPTTSPTVGPTPSPTVSPRVSPSPGRDDDDD